MRILIDITHPAHLHFFRHVIPRLREAGHELKLTGRDKDILRQLAGELDFDLEFFGGSPAGVIGMARTLLGRKRRLRRIVRAFQPDVMAALGGTFIGALGWWCRVPTVVFYDTENATLSNRITYPFAGRICTPAAYLHDVPRQVRYAGYHELAYLAPDVFTPDPAVAARLRGEDGRPYAIVRFVGWEASHDLGMGGIPLAGKRRLIERLRSVGRVHLSSEGPLPPDLEALRFPLPLAQMHDAIAGAAVVVGESSTMASEAAVLGVPSVLVHPRIERGYTQEQAERWGIVHWYEAAELDPAAERAAELLRGGEAERWRAVGRQIAAASVDVVDFAVRQIVEAGGRGVDEFPGAKVGAGVGG
jgi:predicted glycosyltransferase